MGTSCKVGTLECRNRVQNTLVDKILAAKKQDSSADTTEWEKLIDQKVYELYGLTEDEIAIVEGR